MEGLRWFTLLARPFSAHRLMSVNRNFSSCSVAEENETGLARSLLLCYLLVQVVALSSFWNENHLETHRYHPAQHPRSFLQQNLLCRQSQRPKKLINFLKHCRFLPPDFQRCAFSEYLTFQKCSSRMFSRLLFALTARPRFHANCFDYYLTAGSIHLDLRLVRLVQGWH